MVHFNMVWRCENEHVLAVGLKVHTYTRNKHLIDYLHLNRISVGYDRILRIEAQLAVAVIKRKDETWGIFIPPGITKGTLIFFAADNIDFLEDTPDGKHTLHGTVMTVFQQQVSSAAVPLQGSLNITGKSTKKALQHIPYSIRAC